MLSFVFLVIGFALMIWGADKFVAGASALARKLGVSPLLIGLTIVAFGTSMPELAVSVTAALRGANEIAVGNVVGSNIFNLLMVAGLSAAVCPLVMDKTLLRRDWPLSILAAVLLLGAIAPDLTIARWEGVVLLIIFAFILTYQIRTALQNREQLAAAAAEAEAEEAEAPMSAAMIWVNILLGLACIVIGGQLAVNGATGIARMFGLSETLIGLTIVAMGTSLPELVTSIVAARKGQNDIAMGNVIGSNLFNIFLILGVSSVITPIPVQATSIVDCLVLIAISAVFYLPARKGKLGRLPGAVTIASDTSHTDLTPVGSNDFHDIVFLELAFHLTHPDRQQANRLGTRQRFIRSLVHMQFPLGESFRMGDPFLNGRDGPVRRNKTGANDIPAFTQNVCQNTIPLPIGHDYLNPFIRHFRRNPALGQHPAAAELGFARLNVTRQILLR